MTICIQRCCCFWSNLFVDIIFFVVFAHKNKNRKISTNCAWAKCPFARYASGWGLHFTIAVLRVHYTSCLVLSWIHVVKLSCGRDLPWICSPRFTKRLTPPDPASWWMLRHLADSGISSQQRPPGSCWCWSHNHQPDTRRLGQEPCTQSQQFLIYHWQKATSDIWNCIALVS